jgi:hypothetical protein
MNTVNKVPTKHLVERQENYCETVKIIKDKTKINILFKNHIFQKKYLEISESFGNPL